MIDTRSRADSSQHRSCIVSSSGGVLSNTSLVSAMVSFLSLANLCSVSISCCLRERHNSSDDGRPVGVVPDLCGRRLGFVLDFAGMGLMHRTYRRDGRGEEEGKWVVLK